MRSTFIVISHPRSGSTYFCNRVMPSSQDVWCYDELFRQDKAPTVRHLNILGLDYYHGNYVEFYLNDHHEKAAKYSGKTIIGFKLFRGHISDHDLRKICENEIYNKILLYRKAIIKSAVSYQIAKTTGQWNPRDKKDFEPFKIDIDKCINWINIQRTFISSTKNYMESNNIKFHQIEYNEIFDVNCVNQVFNFLGARNISDIPPPKEPLNSFERYKMIINIDEVEKEIGSNDNGYLFE